MYLISTHTPHARRDHTKHDRSSRGSPISTHTPHARRDTAKNGSIDPNDIFQLTRLMRGVTFKGAFLILIH